MTSRWGLVGELKYGLVGVAGSVFIRALARSCNGELENGDIPARVRAFGRPVIYAFWHGRLIVPSYTHRGSGIGILVSRSADGEYIARVARRLGFHPIRGSSTRGAEEGFREMLAYLRSGGDVAITPDGPTGPKYEVKKGIVYLARASGAAIVPCGVAIDRYWQFGSWDEFRVMKPGAYVLARFGEPVIVDEHANKYEMEGVRLRLQHALNDITDDVESRVHDARSTRDERPRRQGEPRAGAWSK